MAWLLLVFVVVPLVELALLIRIGQWIGLPATLALVVLTGVLGAYLARRQGLAVIQRVRAELADGHVPAGPLVDGILILVAAAVLMTPGVLTDLFGFFCLIPGGRRLLKEHLKRRLQRAVQRGSVTVSVDFAGAGPTDLGRPEPRDVTPPDEVERPSLEGRS